MRLYTYYKRDGNGQVNILSPSTLEAKNVMDETFGFNVVNYNLVNFDMYELEWKAIDKLFKKFNIDSFYMNTPKILTQEEYDEIKKYIRSEIEYSTVPNTVLAGCENKYRKDIFAIPEKKTKKKLNTRTQDIVRKEVDRSQEEFNDVLDIIKTNITKP